jgi:iron complex outermembrane receptor protein
MLHHKKALYSLLIAAAYCYGAVADTKLEEVIVTAQKREENLQGVPISITAISGAQLETRGIEGSASLNALAPNLQVNKSPGSSFISQISIRGSVTGQPAIYVDPSVGMYVDGVYIAKSQGSLFELLDLERVEVLRGPQGTLFGRNTMAGAINFVTRRPSGVWSGSASIDVGNYGRQVERISLDLPKMGMLSLNVGARNETADGWLKNRSGDDEGDASRHAFRVAAVLDVTPDLQAYYTFDHTNAGESQYPTTFYSPVGTSGTLTSLGNQLIGAGNAFGLPSYIAAGNYLVAAAPQMAPYASKERPNSISTDVTQTGQWLRVNGHALTVGYDLNANNTLKYIGSYRTMEYKDRLDLDGTPVNLILTGRDTLVRNYSHELQWIGHTDHWNYVLGYYFFNEGGHTTGGQHIALSPPPADNKFVNYKTGTDSKALYGQVDWKATDALTLTVGLRRTEERRTNSSSQYATTGYRGPFASWILPWTDASASFNATTPTFSVNYKITDDINVYARLAKGFKSGGFSAELPTAAGVTEPYGPEKSTTYEIGVKSQFADQRAQLNVALFQNKVTDMQLSQLPPGTTTSQIFNAGKATMEGLELEGVFIPVDGWRLQLSYGYLHGKFDEYLDHPRSAATAALAGVSPTALIDTADNRVMPYAPKHTLNLSVDGELARTDWGTLRGIADYTYTTSFYAYAANRSLTSADAGSGNLAEKSQLPALGLLNLRLLLADIPLTVAGKADASLWVRNVANEKKPVNLIDFSYFENASWTPPRTFGLSLNYKW